MGKFISEGKVGRSFRHGVQLIEGLFEQIDGVTIKGSNFTMGNITADAGKMITKHDLVKFTADGIDTVTKVTNNVAQGFILADPEGRPPVSANDFKRGATMVYFTPSETYHVELKDTNAICTPGMFLIWDGTGWDVSATKPNGVILIAREPAGANSGKVIDVYCEQTAYVIPAP